MYYPVNWPRVIRLPVLGSPVIHHVVCNRDKILVAVLSSDTLTILYNKVFTFLAWYPQSWFRLTSYLNSLVYQWLA